MDGGGGGASPNIDLSKIDNTPNSIIDAIKKGDWYGVGVALGEKLNEAMDNIPWDKIKLTTGKIGKGIAELFNGFIKTTDWTNVGKTFAEGLNTVIEFAYNFFTTFDFKAFGSAIGNTINGLFDNVDWSKLAQKISEEIKGIFDTISGFFQTLDWQIIVDAIVVFFANIDWSGIASSVFEALGSALGSLVKLGAVIGGYIKKAFTNIGKYFNDKIEECGGNIVLGILKGIGDAVVGIGQWIYENIFKPFIDGFKDAFGIHSPSTVMAEMGGYIIEGLKNGLSNIWDTVKSIFEGFKTNVVNKFNEIKTAATEKFNNIKENISNTWDNIKTTASQKWNDIKTSVSSKWDSIKNNATEKFNNIKQNISNTWNKIKSDSSLSSMVTTIKDKFSGLAKNAITWGKDLTDNMASGIRNGIEKVKNAAKSVANGVKNFLGFSEPDEGPLSNFHTYMPDMIDLMVKGIHDNMGRVTKELENLTGTMAYTINTPDINSTALSTSLALNSMKPKNTVAEVLNEALINHGDNMNIAIPLSLYIGNEKLGQILLNDLRNKKRQTGQGIEALIGG